MNTCFIYVFDYENCQILEIDCMKEELLLDDIDSEVCRILDENEIRDSNCYYMYSPHKLEIKSI